MPEATKTQADQRMTMNGADRFGRVYLYNREVHTKHGGICGQITNAGWDYPAGFVVEQKYLSVPKNRPYTVVIDYAAIIRDCEQALVAWQLRVDHIIDTMPRFAGVKPEKPTDAVIRLAGPKPSDPEGWRKAQAGNWKYLTADGKRPPALAQEGEEEPAVDVVEQTDAADAESGVAVGSRGRGR